MDSPSPSIRHLARRLLAAEAAGRPTTDAPEHEAVLVCERLRVSLTRFAGGDGFAALIRRAIALARVEVPSLEHITVNPDNSIEGFEDLPSGAASSGEDGTDEAAALIAHLLGLLVTFIGEPLTLQLVRESWPVASLDE